MRPAGMSTPASLRRQWIVGTWEGYVITVPPETFGPNFVHFMKDGTFRQEALSPKGQLFVLGARPFTLDGGFLILDHGSWQNRLEIWKEPQTILRLRTRTGLTSRWERLAKSSRYAGGFVDE